MALQCTLENTQRMPPESPWHRAAEQGALCPPTALTHSGLQDLLNVCPSLPLDLKFEKAEMQP